MMRKLLIVLSLVLAAFSNIASANDKTSCKMIDEATLSIWGEIKAPLLNCVKSLVLSKLNTLLLDTNGGDMRTAMAVGDILAPYRPHMIIDKDCNSSCANYWVPLARKITFSEDARIVIHGSADTGLWNKMTAEERKVKKDVLELIERQEQYRKHHNIPRGWMQYRTDYAKHLKAYEPWLVGKPKIPLWQSLFGEVTILAFIVNTPMLKTCLPDIEIEGFKNSYAEKISRKSWRQLAKEGRLSSGTMACPAETAKR